MVQRFVLWCIAAALTIFQAETQAAEYKITAPNNLKVSYVFLTAPFKFDDGSTKIYTAIILTYESKKPPWSASFNSSTVAATLKNGKTVPGAYFFCPGGFQIQASSPGTLDFKQVTIKTDAGERLLLGSSLGDIKVETDRAQAEAWLLFAIDDPTVIVEVTVGEVKLASTAK